MPNGEAVDRELVNANVVTVHHQRTEDLPTIPGWCQRILVRYPVCEVDTVILALEPAHHLLLPAQDVGFE